MHDFRAMLPDIKQCITSQLQKYNAELQSLGGPLGDGNSSSIVLIIITEFTNEFRTVISGNTNDLLLNELSSGTRISFVSHEPFNVGVKGIDPVDQVKDGDTRTILSLSVRAVIFVSPFGANSEGRGRHLLVTAAFEVIMRQQIKWLGEPGFKFCPHVYDEYIRILNQLLPQMVRSA